MNHSILISHVRQESYRKPLVASVAGHVVLFTFTLLAGDLFPAGEVVEVGSGAGGGQGGDFVTVGLRADLSGGSGMYKPSLTAQPQAAPPLPRQEETAPPPSRQDKVFVEKTRSGPPARESQAASEMKPESAPAGAIPREPAPGSGGPGGRSTGSGGGFGRGQGVKIGSGTGQGFIDSWYARQVEQRIGQNWLRTSLGELARPVETVVAFEIRADGHIESIEIQRPSGIRSVDLAAERAVQASNPLPPLPYEFRNRRVRFVAYFQYPPR